MKLEILLDNRFKSGVGKLAAANLPLRAAFKLKGIIASIDAELKKYEEVRTAALQKYGKKKEDGTLLTAESGNVQFEEENLKTFFKELAELSSTEVEIAKLKLSELGENAVNVSVEELSKLEAILED